MYCTASFADDYESIKVGVGRTMKNTAIRVDAVALCLLAAAAANAQGPGGGGMYSGPNVLSRWSKMGGAQPVSGTSLRGYIHVSYGYLEGLAGPVENFSSDGTNTNNPTVVQSAATHNATGGGSLSLTHTDAHSALTLGYQANYTYSHTNLANPYRGLNQDVNFTYERQLSRRWGFYTGETAGSQRSLLGLVRPTSQRNYFDQAYTSANEALDQRLKYVNVGGGMYFQKSSRWNFSADAGAFLVSRQSQALVSSRGERAQGEASYRLSKSQSIGAVYSFSHFYYVRGFGETYVHSVMLAYGRRLNRNWNLHINAGPHQADSERLRSVPVDPYIAALTGQASTIEAFRGVSRGLSVSAGLSGVYRKSYFYGGYRRAVDPGNGLTLTALNDFVNFNYSYRTSRNVSMGFSLFGSRMNPLLTGADRGNSFRAYGGSFNGSYRINDYVHALATMGWQKILYDQISVRQGRTSITLGLAFSPGELPIGR